MKVLFTILLTLILCPQCIQGQNIFKRLKNLWPSASESSDVILKRDGTEVIGKIVKVSLPYTYYKLQDKDNTEEQVCANSDVYLIKFADRGNMFFSEYGDFFFGDETGDIEDDAILLYLLKGEEIIAYNVSSDDQHFRYYLDKDNTDFRTIPKRDVFVVKYPNRANEIVTPFLQPEGRSAAYIQGTDMNNVLPNMPMPEDKFVELKEAKPAKEYILRTYKKANIRALVVYESDSFVSYYRKEAPKGPLYRMDRKNIKSLTAVRRDRR